MPTPAQVVKELAKRQLKLEARIDAQDQKLDAILAAVGGGGLDGWDEEITLDDVERDVEARAFAEEQGWSRREVEPGIFEYRSPTSERHREFREQLANALAWVDWVRPTSDDGPPPLTAEQGVPAFIEGGAMWLYDYDRDFIFWHGPDVFHALVADVLACGDEPTARELSADLLKDRDQGPMGMSDGTLDQMYEFTKGGFEGGVQGTGFGGGGRKQ